MNTIAERRATAWLKKGTLRSTRQRLALAELLVGKGQDCHVTAEGLFDAAQAKGKVSLATVYNTLHAFCEAGLMKEITVDGHKSYFDTRIDEHPHFFWENDSKLTDAPAHDMKFARLPEAPKGTAITKVDVVIRLRTL